MAKNSNVSNALIPGMVTSGDMAEFLTEGFAESRIIKVGKKEGQIPFYIGKLIGPGRPVEIKDDKTGEVSNVPTWAFKPVVAKDGSVQENVTHVMLAPHQLNQELGRIFDTAERGKKTAIVAIQENGQVDTRRGYRVNDYRIAEKYVG